MKDKFILNTNDYTYAPYSNKGFSGQLYLAMPKNGGKRLIIKHENPCSAGNEFMYSRLAGLLGIPTPTTYLMNVAKEDDNTLIAAELKYWNRVYRRLALFHKRRTE